MATSSTILYSVNASFPKVNAFNKTLTKTPFCSVSSSSTAKSEKLVLTGKGTLSYISNRRSRICKIMASSTTSTEIEKLGIKIVKNPTEAQLSELGVRSWPKWGCPPSKFPWTYSARETCLLLQGKVKVYPEGSDEAVEIGAGDLVIFPKGMSCTWDVSEAVDKHYNFD